MKTLLEPISSSKILVGGRAKQLRIVNLTISLQARAEERRDSRSSNSRNRNPPLQRFYSTRSTHIRQCVSIHPSPSPLLILLSPQVYQTQTPMPLAYWEVEKIPTYKTNKVPESLGLSSHYLFLAFECRSPRNWWVETGFTHPGI